MTEQEIFSMAYIGLAKQGFERSFNDDTRYCLYRDPAGRKCAIGHCIPDEIYDEEFENMSLGDLTKQIPGLSGSDIRFLEDLRSCHDKSYGPASMKKNLHVFAEENEFSIPKENK